MPDYEELDLTGLEIDDGKWAGAVIRANFGQGYKAKTVVGLPSGLHQWTLSSECLTDDDSYNDQINGMPSFEYYLDFFQRFTTGDDDVFVIDFRGRKYHAGLVETEMPFEMLTYDLFSSKGVAIEQRRVPGFTYEADGSLPPPVLPDPPTGLRLTVLSSSSILAEWDPPADTEAPSVPTMSAATGITDTVIDWNWSAATDDTAVTGYDLQVAEDAGFSTGLVTHNLGNVLTYHNTGLANSTQYFARVRAHDAVPNNSAYSSSVNATTEAHVFTPDDLTGLWTWLKADVLALSDGDDVVSWTDSSGNARHATSAGGQRPVFKTNILNSLPVIRYSGSVQFFSLPDPSALTECEVFVVIKLDADPPAIGQSGLWRLFDAASGGTVVTFSDGKIYESFGSTVRKDAIACPQLDDAFHVYSVFSATNDWENFLDGSSLFSTATNTVALDATAYLGSGTPASQDMDGDMAEFILYDRKLTGPERASVLTYLQDKYGI